MDKALIECRSLCKDYDMGGEVIHALKNVSLQIHKGEYVAIMGPSGSGKSTLMNLVGALDVPSSGDLLVNGLDLSRRIITVHEQFICLCGGLAPPLGIIRDEESDFVLRQEGQ